MHNNVIIGSYRILMLRRSSKKLSKFLTRIKMVIFQPMR
jgi:hypothetical protein